MYLIHIIQIKNLYNVNSVIGLIKMSTLYTNIDFKHIINPITKKFNFKISGFSNYDIKIKKKIMYVYYCIDSSTCSGFNFILFSKIYGKMSNWGKCLILKENLITD